MRRNRVTLTSVSDSSAIPINTNTSGFAIGVGVKVTGTVTYTVQHTFDNVLAGEVATWYDHPTLAAQTANASSNYAFPIAAVRLRYTAGTGTCELTLIEAGVTP